jgi:hypothetical protein
MTGLPRRDGSFATSQEAKKESPSICSIALFDWFDEIDIE